MGKTLEQLLADEKPEVVARAQETAAEMLLGIHLLLLFILRLRPCRRPP